jgi:hypothetical protein
LVTYSLQNKISFEELNTTSKNFNGQKLYAEVTGVADLLHFDPVLDPDPFDVAVQTNPDPCPDPDPTLRVCQVFLKSRL